MRRALLAVPALLGAVLVVPASGQPEPPVDQPRVAGVALQFVPSSLRMARGQQPLLLVADLEPHNVVSVARNRRGPLFRSATVGLGETAEVTGADRLGPGVYAFFCSVHEAMRGELVVLP